MADKIDDNSVNVHESSNGTTIMNPSSDIPPAHKTYQFWAIIGALCVTGLLGALENTVVATSLPAIVESLHIGQEYIWITNIFFLTSAAVQPLFGQLANLFGRRWLTMFIVATYTLGSGICGGANNGATLIAGRAIQGIGSGGVYMIVDVIISDLVPLRQRGNYIAIVLCVYAIGISIGPFVGGIIVERTTWRWVFYINLPVGGIALVLVFLFLRVKQKQGSTLREKLKRIDYIGNFLVIGSTVSILYALTYGGALYSWTDARVVAPLVIGLFGSLAFLIFEGSRWVRDPVTPLRLFSPRSGLIIGINTFMNSVLVYWVLFFLPVYFQGVLLSSPARAGVQLLPIVLVSIPGAALAVIALSKFGRYKEMHVAGFAIETLSLGLFSIMNASSHTAEWVIYQLLAGLGSGMLLNTLLPAFQAGVPEADQAAATASWAFLRSFGNIWGVAIPAAIFGNRVRELAPRISDISVREYLTDGLAYQYATRNFMLSLQEPTRAETIEVFVGALQYVWYTGIVFSGISFCLAMFEKPLELRKELDTEYSMETVQKT